MGEYNGQLNEDVEHNTVDSQELLLNSLEGNIRSFLDNSATSDLLRDFGYQYSSESQSLQERLASLKSFTNGTWDFRAGGERYQALQKELTPEQEERILVSADRLGMIEAVRPSKKNYDAIIILGAMGQQPLKRTEYAHSCGAEAPIIISLGTENILPPDKSATMDYAPNAKTEFDLMAAAVEKVYGRDRAETEFFGDVHRRRATRAMRVDSRVDELFDSLRNEGSPEAKEFDYSRWKIRHYEGSGTDFSFNQPDIFVLSAPSSDPAKRRANTADTYAFMSELLPKEANNLLLVTCSIFQPFQQFDAQRMLTLPFGKHIETVGFDTRKSKSHKPQNYLQEINSAVNSAWFLHQAIELSRKG